jgi:hypothetical protein
VRHEVITEEVKRNDNVEEEKTHTARITFGDSSRQRYGFGVEK